MWYALVTPAFRRLRRPGWATYQDPVSKKKKKKGKKINLEYKIGDRETALGRRAPAAPPEDPGSIPSTHMAAPIYL